MRSPSSEFEADARACLGQLLCNVVPDLLLARQTLRTWARGARHAAQGPRNTPWLVHGTPQHLGA